MRLAAAPDSSQVDESYRYWRLHLMAAMYVGYGVFYFTRKASISQCQKCCRALN